MFEFLFKYSRETFERAEFVFASGWPLWLLIALVVLAAVGVAVSLARRRQGLGLGRTIVLGVLQSALLAVLLVLAWRPALVTQTLRPQENSVAVLVDTSASMLYGDANTSRLQQAIQGISARALPELKSKFNVNLYSFAGDAVELPSLDQVPAPGPRSRCCPTNFGSVTAFCGAGQPAIWWRTTLGSVRPLRQASFSGRSSARS